MRTDNDDDEFAGLTESIKHGAVPFDVGSLRCEPMTPESLRSVAPPTSPLHRISFIELRERSITALFGVERANDVCRDGHPVGSRE
jgi:hypothetical protein